MGIYNIIRGINNSRLFKYLTLIILSYLFFKNKNIGLNVFLAIIIAISFIIYNYDEIETKRNIQEEQQNIKRESIKPTITNFKDKDDLVDFLFSVQDMYHYNPQAYEEIIDNLESFFNLYSYIKLGSKYCDQYYQIAESKKNNAINSFHSMIFSIPNSKTYMDKFNRAHKRFETIMNVYLNELYDECNYDLIKNGYNVHRKYINTGPKEYNHYFDKDYTYQFY